MAVVKRASAQWKGSGKEGSGTVSTQSKALDNVSLSFKSRFEEGPGTNPEELIGAAHAGCFSMKLSFVLGEMGFTAEQIDTAAKVTLDDGKITQVDLSLKAKVPGITAEQFETAALNAKENCPVSKSLNASVTLQVELLG